MNNIPKLLVYSLDDQQYGIFLDSITQVIHAVEVTIIPKASQLIEGIVNVHGDLLPVINLRQYLGLANKPLALSDRFLVINISSVHLIVVVDAVIDIIDYVAGEEVSTDTMGIENPGYLQGVLKKENNLIFIIDVLKIFSKSDFQTIEEMMKKRSQQT
jgi:purine-binding chemotaxis protein CheW